MSFAIVPFDMIGRLGGHSDPVVVVSWLDFRTRMENPATYERDGYRWWRVTVEAMARELKMSPQTCRTSIKNAEAAGAILIAEHRTQGWTDRAKSYTVTNGFRQSFGAFPSTVVGSENPVVDSNKSYSLPKSTTVPSYKEEEKYTATSSQASTRDKKSKLSSVDAESFETWWKVYPRRIGKAQAKKAYLTALKKTTPDRLLQAAQSFAKTKEAEGTEERFIPHPTTWLNGERWEDERSAGDEFDRLLARNDVSGVEALVKDRYREPVEFVELSPGEREHARREDFRRWALERRGKIDG